MSQPDDLRDPLEVLAAEFMSRQRRGESPSIFEYAQRHPELAADIEELFPTIAAMEQLKLLREGPQSGHVSLGAVRLERLGDFRILGEIGRGGMGIVYEALQESLGRHVAVKVLPKQLLLDPKQLCRFQREAQTAARLHHTNIVPVFGVGEHEGFHFIVMQLIRGVGLDAVLDKLRQAGPWSAQDAGDADTPSYDSKRTSEVAHLAKALAEGKFWQSHGFDASSPDSAENEWPSRTETPTAGSTSSPTVGATEDFIAGRETKPNGSLGVETRSFSAAPSRAAALHFGLPYWRSIAAIGLQVAEALHYAHGHHTLHRDIKPANLLLDSQGMVWITDFGLAKAMEHDNLTQTGAMAGTLRYMAPEQFAGQFDARSDVYSLGLTLYEMLALQPAFEDTSRSSLIRKITCDAPTRPRKFSPRIPRDLETIVLKAIAREPSDRYQTVGELARDLECFLDDRPIKARRTSAAERLWRWSRRNKALAGLAASTLALLILVAVVASVGYIRTTRANVEEARQRKKAEDTSALALDALDNIFQQFAPERTMPASGLSVVSDTGEEITVPVQPVLSKEAAALLEHMLDFYDRLAAQEGGDARLQRKVAQANRRVGDIRQRLGQYDESKAAYLRAIELYARLAETSGGDTELSTEIARIQNELGNVHWAMNEQGAGHACYLDALATLKSVSGESAASPHYKYELARTYYFLGRRPGGRPGPPPLAIGGRRGPRPDHPGEFGFGPPGPRGGPGGPREHEHGPPPNPPDALFGPEGPPPDSRPPFPFMDQDESQYNLKKAVGILEQLVAEHPSVPDYRHLLARCYRDSSPQFFGPGPKLALTRRTRQPKFCRSWWKNIRMCPIIVTISAKLMPCRMYGSLFRGSRRIRQPSNSRESC